MFHLTVPDIVDALIAAKTRGIDVRIILDSKNLDNRASGAIAQRLVDRGIDVTRSSPAFSITHVKAFVVDDTRAVVMSLNLTRPFDHTRDYAVVTDDAAVVADFLKVFDADIDNAAHRTGKTPDGLTSTALVWSPESEARISQLIDSAHATIIASTENLGDKAIHAAFTRAENRGVKVRVLVPMCDLGSDPTRNLKFVGELDHAHVDARVMPAPATREQPYTHAKMIIVDGTQLFLGSTNFSENSTRHARELAIIVGDHAVISAVTTAFEADWRFAAPPPPPKAENVCPRDPRDQTALPIAW